ncbi:MAG: YidC/Oxa1 family rane protein insertase, partial [Pseudonocardiales bacterium]|nr:YidC/Oxa1 family rane protein insertase [Pseudonocardiales bacterium]
NSMFVVANILQPLIDINEAILGFWHDQVGFGWGASIIGLTIVIRMLILPLTFKQVRSMQALQRLQPEMKKIQARYKDDKQRQQQAMMEFYKEHQVNPLGSCLPLILQFPFFIGLYQTLRSVPFKREVGDAGQFFFIPNITKPLTGHTTELVVMIVLYVGTQLASSYVSSFNVQDKNQKRLLFVFPFLFVPVVINFQAGLLVYWVTTNVWTIGQQLFVRKFLPPPEPHVATAAGSDGGGKAAKTAGARAVTGGKARSSGGNGGKAAPSKKDSEKAATTAGGAKGRGGSNGGGDGGPQKAPPPAPRKKKKRSGRRR